eukprot:gene10136-11874_t
MLHELLFALLGFVGDIIIEKNDTFCIKDGFDLLREGERDQVNRLAPLGWYYVNLGNKVAQHDIGWSKSVQAKAYMTSMVQGVSDLLQEYVADVSYLEQLILADGPVPLSQVLQHLQKYLLVFPQLYAMLEEIEVNNIQGCRILDYFYNYNTGVPVLQEVINRIVLRLRVVFLKQCFAWMVHGELDDPGFEFFVQGQEIRGATRGMPSQHQQQPEGEVLLDQVMRKLHQAKLGTEDMFGGAGTNNSGSNTNHANKNFDWTSSYTLRLENIPGSHVSPRIAGKILFAGKAVKLLQSSGLLSNQNANQASCQNNSGLQVNAESLGYASSDAYKYLSSGSAIDAPEDWLQPDKATEKPANPLLDTFQQQPNTESAAAGSDPQVRRVYQQYVESGGYTVEDTVLFTEQFSHILRHPDQAVELLEAAVEGINDTISNRLWVLLRDSYGFLPFLQVIRSTYLLGRGELFQSLLDGVLALTLAPTPAGLEMDNILNWKVLRSSAKLVGLENDDSLNELIKLRVNNADMVVRNFVQHKPDLQLLGAATELPVLGFDEPSPYATPASVSSAAQGLRVGQRTLVELCRPAASSSYEQFQRTWTHFLRKKVISGDHSRNTSSSRGEHTVPGQMEEKGAEDDEQDISDLDDDSLEDDRHIHKPETRRSTARNNPDQVRSGKKTSSLKYCRGAIRILDQKFVSRGFVLSSTFLCSWNDLRAQLTSHHPFFQASSNEENDQNPRNLFPPLGRGARVVALGSVACALYSDRKSDAQGQGSGRAGSLSVGVKFFALTMQGVNGVRYFARLFLRSGNSKNSSGFSASSYPHSVEPGFHEDMIGDGVIDIDDNLQGLGLDQHIQRSVSSSSAIRLHVEYVRSLQRDSTSSPAHRSSAHASDAASVRSYTTAYSSTSYQTHAHSAYNESSGASVVYSLRARVDDSSRVPPASPAATALRAASSVDWDLDVPLDLPSHVKCQGGQAYVSLEGEGLVFPANRGGDAPASSGTAESFSMQVLSLDFSGKGALSTYPVASPLTFTRYPDTFARIQTEVDRIRAWMHMKLQLSFPPMFRVIFDADAVTCYERIFSAIMKVRVVAHALERLWIARSRLAADRTFCQSRHSMHFFVSNLLYYLQVDVVDSEYSILQRDIATSSDFQSVLRAHKTFTSNMLRLSLIDNTSVQEGIERILQVCLRFIAVCRIQHQVEDNQQTSPADDEASRSFRSTASHTATREIPASQTLLQSLPIYVPPEELGFIRKDFFAQVTLLFQLMRKVESRGFIFRLDFNSFLSNSALDSN